ncbi:MAG: DUF4430 domain-containing protein [Coriobacteriia bacterium]|nr:DUF4430 domain-containing protein [Coriobacteriia bacterium]
MLMAAMMLFGMLPGTALAALWADDPTGSQPAAAPIAPAGAAVAAEGEITVYIDFEGYNLGQGFYIEPTALVLPEGSTAADATEALLDSLGYENWASGRGTAEYYLQRIKGLDKGFVDLPAYLLPADWWDEYATDAPGSDGMLGEFSYTSMSGWMLTVNHEMIGTSAGAHELADGDVIRWQFTVYGYGSDIGVVNSVGGEPVYDHVDKTALVQALFSAGATSEDKAAALGVLINPLATAQEVADATAALLAGAGETEPDEYWFVIDSPSSAQDLMDKIATLLVADFGQADVGSPVAADTRYDFSVVQRLKVTGLMGSYLFNYNVSRNNLSPYLEQLDISNTTGPIPSLSGASASENYYGSLKSVTMPARAANGHGPVPILLGFAERHLRRQHRQPRQHELLQWLQLAARDGLFRRHRADHRRQHLHRVEQRHGRRPHRYCLCT